MKKDFDLYDAVRKRLSESILSVTSPLRGNVALRAICIAEATLIVLLSGLQMPRDLVQTTLIGVLDGIRKGREPSK